MSYYRPDGDFASNRPSPNTANGAHFNGGTAPPTPMDPIAEKITRHKDYYLSSGDVHFLVENYMFRVHRYFFERESAHFREKLALPAMAGHLAGGTADTPIHLEDVRGDDFAKFLWVFYNPKYSIYDASADDWTVILRLASDWRFPNIKALCCRELEKFTIEPVRKIETYQKYEIDRTLLLPSYVALTVRAEPIGIKEGRQLGLETSILLASARETIRAHCGSPVNPKGNQDFISGVITKAFGLDRSTPVESSSEPHNFAPGSPSRLAPVMLQPLVFPPTNGHAKKNSQSLSRAPSPPPIKTDLASLSQPLVPAKPSANGKGKSPAGDIPNGTPKTEQQQQTGTEETKNKQEAGDENKGSGTPEPTGTPTTGKPPAASKGRETAQTNGTESPAAGSGGDAAQGDNDQTSGGNEVKAEPQVDQSSSTTGPEQAGEPTGLNGDHNADNGQAVQSVPATEPQGNQEADGESGSADAKVNVGEEGTNGDPKTKEGEDNEEGEGEGGEDAEDVESVADSATGAQSKNKNKKNNKNKNKKNKKG